MRYPQMNPAAPVTSVFMDLSGCQRILRPALAGRPEVPKVDHELFRSEGERSIHAVGRAQHDDVSLLDGVIEGGEVWVLDEGVGAEYLFRLYLEQRAKLIGQAVPPIVGIAFECHSKDCHAAVGQ